MYYFPRHLTNATAQSIYTVLESSAYYVSASKVTTLRRYTNLFIIIYYYYIYGAHRIKQEHNRTTNFLWALCAAWKWAPSLLNCSRNHCHEVILLL